jgi:outer membrane receptor protein involved in Fe transport
MRRAILLTGMMMAFCMGAWAQTGKISGLVMGEGGQPLENATVSLMKSTDTVVLKFAVAGKTGAFEFERLPFGIYRVSISAMGYQNRRSNVIELTEAEASADLGKLTLSLGSNAQLEGITVTAKRPLFEVKPDKTIVNVESAVSNVGATALEVLEKSPGVIVDRDGNISLKGKAGVTVMIDGKPSYLTGPELTNLLQSMAANQVDQIELMSNPPAKFDAAGNGGVINIKTKKGKQRGFNGNLSLGYGQGVYSKSTNSLALNYRNNKFNAFMNYTVNANQGFGDLVIDRTYYDPIGTITGYVFQPTFMRFKPFNNNFKLGVDYMLTSKTTIGITGSGFINKGTFLSSSTSYLQEPDKTWDTAVNTVSETRNNWKNGAVNLNLRHQISKDREFTADIDYIRYAGDNQQLFNNTMLNSKQEAIDQTSLKGLLPSSIHILSGKADYTQTFSGGLKLDAGWKSSVVRTDNEANYYNDVAGDWVPDYDKTNHFIYEENINAIYVNGQKKMGKFNVQTGLRFEHTNYTGNQLGNPRKQDSTFSRSYGSLFPTAYITYESDSANTFTVNVGRRINRPAYQQLNPFLFFINQYTYQEGNPYLQPEFTWNVELGHTYKNWLTTTVGYAYTDQVFSQVFRTEGEVTVLTFANLQSRRSFNVSSNAQLKPAKKWWSMNVQLTGSYASVRGMSLNDEIRSDAFSRQVNINNQFKFKKGWSAELSGFYNSRSQDGQFTIQAFSQVSAGVSKTILKDKGTLRLNVRDIFFGQVIDGQIDYQNVMEHFRQSRDSRVANLAFTYRFGKTFKETAKRKSGSAGDEQQRVGVQ